MGLFHLLLVLVDSPLAHPFLSPILTFQLNHLQPHSSPFYLVALVLKTLFRRNTLLTPLNLDKAF